jgi:exosome complex exonuclease DIS3/RRP44
LFGHFSDTYIERLPKESSNDRNDRAIRKAAVWYQSHIDKSAKEQSIDKIKVLLLTDDADNRKKAEEDGLAALSVRDYVKSLSETPFLQDKLSLKEYGSEHNNNPLFPPHLTLVHIHDGIKNGKLYQGSFAASRENFLEGNVNVECFEKSVSLTHWRSL